MDESKVLRAEGLGYAGAVVEHRRLGGACVSRIMHPPGQHIGAHEHDWPVLAIHRLGAYRERREDNAAIVLDGPSVVFQPAGAFHADEIGDSGLETLSMTFDPAWLHANARAVLPARTTWRPGGSVAVAARALAEIWLDDFTSEGELQAKTSAFLIRAFATEPRERAQPAWTEHIVEAAEQGDAPTNQLARELARHPAWLARAYRAWRGEGIAETVRRRRVERAVLRLRFGGAPLADIAAECGFCDQSHMNRAFRTVLGRTPLEVRREAALLCPLVRTAVSPS